MQAIHVIATGGTIEKVYSEQTGTVRNEDNKLERYFRQIRLPDTDVDITHVMNIDSLDMTDQDRLKILDTIRQLLARQPAPVIVTHGTDTLIETGKLLQRELTGLQFPIVMTGAMTPLGFEGSDGLQNLTESLLAARVLPAAVYLVIHNQVFPIAHCRKDREKARFVYVA